MEKSSELKAVMLGAYEALSSGDIAFFERHVSRADGALMIGTDPNEWWVGHPSIIELFKVQKEELGLFPIPVIPGDVQAFVEGSVGWVADRPKFKIAEGVEVPVRLTFVFHQEDKDWKIVQWHASIGISNEDLFGKPLTTG